MIGLKQLYNTYFHYVLPRVGQTMAKNNRAAYEYLPQSVQQFPSGEALAAIMRQAGLVNIEIQPMTLGVVTLYLGRKSSKDTPTLADKSSPIEQNPSDSHD
jgi:demethylmenaquinone methyltransferase/2-methoxy-6-polyprenyl-1,4-benzoquinol methylase